MTDKPMHAAFVEAYADMNNPKKNASNPAFKSKYANLEELLNVTRPILAAVGFALVQEPVSDGESIGVHTKLLHTSGDVMDFGGFTVPLTKHDAQGAGSAITCTRRYAIASIFGLAQEDDDGNAASATKPAANSSGAPAGAIGSDAPIIRAIFGKKSALGMTDAALKAAIKRDFGGKEHPGDLTMAEAKALADRMQAAIDAKKPAEEMAPDPGAPTAEELAAMDSIPF